MQFTADWMCIIEFSADLWKLTRADVGRVEPHGNNIVVPAESRNSTWKS